MGRVAAAPSVSRSDSSTLTPPGPGSRYGFIPFKVLKQLRETGDWKVRAAGIEVRDSLGDPGGVTVLNSVALTPPGSNPTAFGPSCCRSSSGLCGRW